MSKRKIKAIACFLWVCSLLLLFHVSLKGQINPRFTHLNIKNGLSQNSINCIFQDTRGFMWFGTEDGLNKYDGYRFTIFKHDPDIQSSLSHNFIYAFHEDEDGNIWIGTYGGGLSQFDPITEIFTHYRNVAGNPRTICNDKIFTFCPGERQTLWIGTDMGLSLFDIEKRTFKNYSLREQFNEEKEFSILTIFVSRDGKTWLGTMKNGLIRFDLKNKTWTRYQHDPKSKKSISNDSVWCIHGDENEFLWIGTRHGLNKFDPKTESFYPVILPGRQKSESFDSVFCLMDDTNGDMWIGTWGNGILLYNRKTGKLNQLKNDPLKTSSLSGDFISAFYMDRSGLLWIGTYGGGLNKFNPRHLVFKHYYHHPKRERSLSQSNVTSIFQDRSNNLWIGTNSGGLNKYLPESNSFKHYRHQPGNPNSLCSDEIWDIKEDYQGYLWIATRHGLNRFNMKNGKFLVFKHNPGNEHGIANNFISTIYEDHARTLWLGSYGGGLMRYERQTGKFFKHYPSSKTNSITHRNVYTLLEDNEHGLWIGTYGGGLNRLERDRKTFTHFMHDPKNSLSISQNEIVSLYQDTKGQIWVGTLGGGLNKYLPEKDGFMQLREKDGLANGVINGILEDDQGNLWLSTYGGISCIDPVSGKIRNFDVRDGLQSNEFNRGAYFKNHKGILIFGGINGFNMFDPEQIKLNRTVPALAITAFHKFNKKMKLAKPIYLKGELSLNHRDKFISFDFSLLDYTIPEKNKYAYKLEGFHDQWIQTGFNRNSVNFTNLDPGSYVFRIKGANNDGVWNETGRALRIVIEPPFWRLWWFQLLALLMFAVLSYLIIGFVKKYVSLSSFWKTQKHFGKFRVIEKIGSGGMGTIYKARNLLDRTSMVALKVLREELFTDEINQRRFKQEAAIIDQLEHPHIVRIIERGQHKQSLFIAMELLEGKTLASRIKEVGRVPVEEALPIMMQITDAIVKIHGKNIIHRDLKPANIMLVKKKKIKNYVKLLDFGLAKMEHQTRVTQTGMVVGTIDYMAPEQVSKAEFSSASDIYSLGVLFYEILTAKRPFTGDSNIEIMTQILNDPPVDPLTLNNTIPHDLNILVMNMLAKEIIARPSISEIYYKLNDINSDLNDK